VTPESCELPPKVERSDAAGEEQLRLRVVTNVTTRAKRREFNFILNDFKVMMQDIKFTSRLFSVHIHV
jgi:hypothetical protein